MKPCTAFENSRDTGELHGIARVLSYDVRNRVHAPPPMARNGAVQRVYPELPLAQVLTRIEGDSAVIVGSTAAPFPLRSGRRSLIEVLMTEGTHGHYKARYRCDLCSRVETTSASQWRKAYELATCPKCTRHRRREFVGGAPRDPAAERERRRFEELTRVPYGVDAR